MRRIEFRFFHWSLTRPVPELERAVTRPIPLVPRLIFATRWLQLPLYVGLILAQAVYVYHFWVELVHLIEAAFGDANALNLLIKSIGYVSNACIWKIIRISRNGFRM